MHEPNIEKLRRFGLAVALVILTYSVAGISLDPNSVVSIVGLAFKVSKPEWLPVGLIFASLYAMASFYYYGFMLKKSPFRVRRDIIDRLETRKPKLMHGRKVPVYFGPTEFEVSSSYGERKAAESCMEEFVEVFPKFARAQASARVVQMQYCDEEGNHITITWPGSQYQKDVGLPLSSRIWTSRLQSGSMYSP